MATLILKVIPEDVTSKANQINAMKNSMEDILSDMDKTIKSLSEVYDSTAGKTYLEKYGKLKISVMSSLETLERNTNCLKRIADLYEEKGVALDRAMNELSDYQVFD